MNSTSLKKLSTCHPDIQALAKEVDSHYPIQCICGERNEADQDKAYEQRMSRVKFPNSKHNINPKMGRTNSWAGDFVPDPDRNPKTLNWTDIKSFERMCLEFEEAARKLKIKIRLGRDFTFKDMPHVELV